MSTLSDNLSTAHDKNIFMCSRMDIYNLHVLLQSTHHAMNSLPPCENYFRTPWSFIFRLLIFFLSPSLIIVISFFGLTINQIQEIRVNFVFMQEHTQGSPVIKAVAHIPSPYIMSTCQRVRGLI